MKRQLLFVQGGGTDTHDKWDNKLVDSLASSLGDTYDVLYPRMPNESNPEYGPWSAKLQNDLEHLHDGAIVIGHSLGGTILINTLATDPPNRALGAIFLLGAPFVGEGGWPADDWTPSGNLGRAMPANVPVHIYHGLADETAPPAHADLYARAIPQAVVTRMPGLDHQFNNNLREVAAAIKLLHLS